MHTTAFLARQVQVLIVPRTGRSSNSFYFWWRSLIETEMSEKCKNWLFWWIFNLKHLATKWISLQILNSIWQRKHRWIGHVPRHDGLLNEITEGKMKGKPTRGRRRIQMLHDLANDGGFVVLKWAAENREGWRLRERKSKTCCTAEDYWIELKWSTFMQFEGSHLKDSSVPLMSNFRIFPGISRAWKMEIPYFSILGLCILSVWAWLSNINNKDLL